MAELILTDAEKAAATWLELDDATIGKLVKSTALKMREFSEEQGRVYAMSAALMLCSIAADANADELTQEIKGFTRAGDDFGDWKITVRRMGYNAEAEPPL